MRLFLLLYQGRYLLFRTVNRFKHLLTLLVFLLCSLYSNGQTIDPKAKPIQVSGVIGGSFSYNKMSGIEQRRQPYGYRLFASVNIRVYGWSFPFSVAISQQGSSFSQPFSFYGVSPQYKWIKLHLGYRNMNFSEFTLGGVSFLGAGVELTPKKFRFSAMYGRLRKAVQEPKNRYEIPQYERNGFGAKVGFGDKTFVDLSLFSAKDNVNSLQNPDSLQLRNAPEASNSVGLTGRFSMVKHQLTLDYDVAMSTFTYDLTANPIDSADGQYGEAAGKLNVNSSSNAAYAGSAGLQYKNELFSTGVKYRYVQSGFRTLGVNYLLSDIEMITIHAATSIIKNRMSIRASYGIQNNNLSENRYAKTARNIGSANINYRATDRLSFNASYSNFSIYQTVLKDSLFADSILVDQMNHLVNFGATYIVITEKLTHSYMLNSSFQELADQRAESNYDAGNQLISVILTYGIRFNKKNFALTFGANYQDFSSSFTAQNRYGANAGFNWQVFERKVSLRFKQLWNRSALADRDDDIFNSQFSLVYALAKKHSLTFSSGLISRVGQNSFNEWTASIGYRMRF